MCHKAWFASIVLLAVAQCVLAQPGDPREQQSAGLRAQIERLEQKLRELEETDKEKRGITQIGNSTIRTADETRLVVRMYDLSELFTVAPPYAARQQSDLSESEKNLFPQVTVQTTTPGAMGGGFGGGGFGGAFSVPDKPKSVANPRPTHLAQVEARSSVNSLVSAIQSTISPSSWDSVGGPMSITQFGNALLVSADANTHNQIEKLLDLFNKRWGTLKTVTVQAWWVPLADEQLAELLSPADNTAAADKPPFGVVDEAAFKKLLGAQREANGSTGYRAAITCYNGQTVSAVAGGESLAVTGLGAVAAGSANAAARVGYSPVVSLIQEGAALQVTPIVTTSGKYVVLDIHSRVARRQAADQRPLADARAEAGKTADGPALPGDVVAALDRPQLVAQRLSTTLRVPIDRTMLVGGMTMTDKPAASEPALYLFVKLVVQELRERAQDVPAGAVKQDAAEKNGAASNRTSPDTRSDFGGRR